MKPENANLFPTAPPPLRDSTRPPKPPRDAPKRPPRQAPDGTPLERAELEAILTRAIRNGEAQEAVQAVKLLQAMRPDLGADGAPVDTRKRIDPAQLVAYVTGWAGLTGAEIIQQLGGWQLVTSKLCAVLRVTRHQLMQGIESAYDRGDGHDHADSSHNPGEQDDDSQGAQA